ncbi:alpha-amylase [Salisediminibacterium halotolerans]|uniref:alpha-amylase n=1 Tax=Salisediminibacterium halotolerans TaxID=517425 RepID=UPI000EB127C6|nr:alpha-amylase [Salisediminibacterium halotolerans]RLJ69685.1 alpha-amylase [Actinophytocola xinjiangensis]RPE89743.1 alpha-amylase [Salisediminibacterium halotolerans]TWG32579.1 alpha-amylase [Salisediminibacterium halotolerans]GEL08078.1 alpha-amylase [Salisediminibacterium halotolerans]
MKKNHTMMQFFEWHIPEHGKHWEDLAILAPEFHSHGIDTVWIPPACKGITQDDNGYGVYDGYDLGEFNQKGGIRTKYGTKVELLQAIEICHYEGIQVLADVVMNHKAGAEKTEAFDVVEVDPNNRQEVISEPFEIDGWTKFDFPVRNGKHSNFRWNYRHFNGTDYDARRGRHGIYRICGENREWSENVDKEFGNYDYLMFANINYHIKAVYDEMMHWGKWFAETTRCNGYRLDAIKHINHDFIRDFVWQMREQFGDDFYFVGEFWNADFDAKQAFLNQVDYQIHLFDVGLHYRFFDAALKGKEFDLRTIFDGTLVEAHPLHAVTFVDNHDSQPGESLESWVGDWFKPLAYALILLREDGFPCVFYGDYIGIRGDDPIPSKKEQLDPLLDARAHLAYGEQIEYFDHPSTIGWVRRGTDEHSGSGCAVVLSNDQDGFKHMAVGVEHSGKTWVDVTGNHEGKITIDDNGEAEFPVRGGTVSVWGLDHSDRPVTLPFDDDQ